jgi:hypothetical protein
MRTPHSSCQRGKRVRVVLMDGSEFSEKFVERTGKFVVTETHKLKVGQIRSFSIAKPKDAANG